MKVGEIWKDKEYKCFVEITGFHYEEEEQFVDYTVVKDKAYYESGVETLETFYKEFEKVSG